MTVEQLGALLGVLATVIGGLVLLVKAITDLIQSFRRRDDKPAPVAGIPAAVTTADDIDYRAYKDLERDRDWWRDLYLQRHPPEHIDEDTEPI
jgi:hypothetical protein